MAGRYEGDKKSSIVEIIGVIAASFGSMGLLIWLVGSNKIVWGSLKPMLAIGSMWKWIPSDFTYRQWNYLVMDASRFARNVSEVSFVDWVSFVNLAATPLTLLISVSYILSMPLLALRKRPSIFRKFTPEQLMEHTVHVFSGVAPVIKIRKKIVNNELPQWRIQVTPQEVFLGSYDGEPMVKDGAFDRGVATRYFAGLRKETIDGRMVSVMLGRQIVDLVRDAGRFRSICFPDRLSNEGKALFALWAAVAFGGQDGKKEYAEYSRKLNMSAYGSPTGMANLTVIQPLYDKYRANKQVANLFAVHHWEHTFLFALLEIAQRRGRYTTAEVLWLRPTNRVMFFALNSCGAKTPHVEAAATFAQVNYEKSCHQQKRLPLVKGSDGRLVHYIAVEKAVDGLQYEYEHWRDGIDEDDEWWSNQDLWGRQDEALRNALSNYHSDSISSIPKIKPDE